MIKEVDVEELELSEYDVNEELFKDNMLAIATYDSFVGSRNKYNYVRGSSPFIDYVCEDKSKYPPLTNYMCYRTHKKFIDIDNDFLMGDSNGILMKIDFIFINVAVFSKVANYYTETGRYCDYTEDSELWDDFYEKEESRRKKGVKAKCKLYFKDIPEYLNTTTTNERRKELLHELRITGEHYNYLNYGRIERVPNDEEKARLVRDGAVKVETVLGFPRFWDGDYWNFKIDELIANNKFNLCKAKARRKGFSYKRGSQAANTLNLYPAVTVILAADKLSYLTDSGATSDMVKKNLDHYENETGFKRGFLSESLENIELGYKVKTEGNKKFGYRSALLSVAIGRNESAAIGKKAIEIDFEEAGKSPNLQNALNVTLSNTESGGVNIGTIRVYGTGGAKDANWAAFSFTFFNPETNDMLPMENVWSANKRHTVCGFFFPQSWCYEPFVWEGNSLLFSAFKAKEQIIKKASEHKSGEDLTIYTAQRADTPEEAFINTKENMFASPDLNAHIADLQQDRTLQFYRDGWVVNVKGAVTFMTKEQCIKEKLFKDKLFHDYVDAVPHNTKTDVHGCVRTYYQPYKIDNKIPDNLYLAVVDTYRVDKAKDEITGKHSLYSIQIWMIPNTCTPYPDGRLLVAEYIGRMDTMEDNDRLLLDMCLLYNAKALIEAGTGETIPNFKKWNQEHRLEYDPTVDRNANPNVKPAYGIVIGDTDRKYDGLRMIKDFINESYSFDIDNNPIRRLNSIYSLRLMLELQRFTSDGNFDHISSMIVYMYFLRAYSIKIRNSTTVDADSPMRMANRLNNSNNGWKN